MAAREAPGVEPLLTPAETAGRFRVDVKTVTRWANTGRLHSTRTPGRHHRFFENEVDAMLDDGDSVTVVDLQRHTQRWEMILTPDEIARLPFIAAKVDDTETVARVEEAIDDGHRLLVFSQFVSMLTLLKERLAEEAITYCYLDGSTTNRQAVVEKIHVQIGHSLPSIQHMELSAFREFS